MSTDHFGRIRHHFDGLASDDGEIRLHASSTIISGLESAPTPAIRTALARLIRGLSSGRKSARLGFAVTLTEVGARKLLSTIFDRETAADDDVSLLEILQMLQSSTKPEGKTSGQEERDHHLGRLFGLDAIMKSGILFKTEPSHTAELLRLLFDLAKKKPWLREECGWIVYRAVQDAPRTTVCVSFVEIVMRELEAAKLARSPDSTAIWLVVRDRYPQVKLPQEPWRHADPLHPENLTALSKVLKESHAPKDTADDGHEKHAQTGTWNSKPHFAWDVIFEILFQPSLQEADRVQFHQFWQKAVDQTLFSASASTERKYWGLMLFVKAFEGAPAAVLPSVFSDNLVRCFVNHLAQEDRYLHRTAHRALKVMHARIEKESSLAIDAVLGLTKPGLPHFDQATKTKTISTLLTHVQTADLEKLQDALLASIIRPDLQDADALERRRRMLADHLVSALRSRRDADDSSYFFGTFVQFGCLGYLGVNAEDHVPTPPVTNLSRTMFRQSLSACFGHLLSFPSELTMRLPYQTLLAVAQLATPKTAASSVDDVSRTRATLSKMEGLRKLDDLAASNIRVRAFQLLYALVALQVLDRDEESASILSELEACLEDVSKAPEKAGDALSATLLEILLSLLSKPSVLLRKLSQQVFAAFAAGLRVKSLQILFDVLDTSESLDGQQALFDEGTSGPESSDDDDVSIWSADSGESASDESDMAPAADEQSDSSSGAVGGRMDVDDDELSRLNAALGQIVGTQPLANGDAGHSDDSSADEPMDDEAMFALDDQMAQVFKERKKTTNKKQQKKDAKELVINLKNRVLDLLEIYLRQQHQNPRVLDVLIPLLRLGRTTTSKQVAEKCRGLIRDLAHRCRGKMVPQLKKRRHACKVLGEIHEEATRDPSRAHATACSQSSLLIVKALVALEPQNVARIVERYGNTQTRWLTGQCRVQPVLFSDFLNWSASFRQQQQSRK